MTVELLSRERGCVIRCNEGDLASSPDWFTCSARHFTALIFIRPNRRAAEAAGWMRGGDKRVGGSGLSFDFCPEHAEAERERIRKAAEHKAEWHAERSEERRKERAKKLEERAAAKALKDAERAKAKAAREEARAAKKAEREAKKRAATGGGPTGVGRAHSGSTPAPSTALSTGEGGGAAPAAV